MTGNSLSDDWRCTKLNSSDILESGTNYISKNNGWVSIIEGVTLDVVENKFTTLGAGSTLKVYPKLENAYTSWYIKFNRTGYEAQGTDEQSVTTDLTLADFNIMYKLKGETDFSTVQGINSTSTSGWSARSLLGLNITPSIDQILYDN